MSVILIGYRIVPSGMRFFSNGEGCLEEELVNLWRTQTVARDEAQEGRYPGCTVERLMYQLGI
ncbi:hypothetical protein [Shimia sp. MMG029]|uniref:hypothetical protein n=1 Tax=Shimia sp. MMG029 TaxID=3021978 RepID=UPI0022FEF846|nr:hypothetical protein [Shimia sp. MMG029]MDA5559055.1 hypothetical protein [Shimia sp. MMG029]